MARIYDNITETIGNTPLVRLNRTAQSTARSPSAAQARILQSAL